MQEVAGRAGQGGVQEREEVLVTDQRAEQAADSAQPAMGVPPRPCQGHIRGPGCPGPRVRALLEGLVPPVLPLGVLAEPA